MNAEEVKIQIKDMIQNIQDSLDLEYLNGEQVKELYKKQKLALEIALNYIDNSISKKESITRFVGRKIDNQISKHSKINRFADVGKMLGS